MKLFGIVGWKNAGKTTLVEGLVKTLTARGFSVSTIKHTHHNVDLDQPGRDSFRHRQAGAHEVVLASSARYAVLHELREAPEPSVQSLVQRLAPVDLVLVEGFKTEGHPKLEVYRSVLTRPPIAEADPSILALATDGAHPPTDRPVLPLDDIKTIADWILREVSLSPGGRTGDAA